MASAPPGVSDPDNWSLVELDGKAHWNHNITGEFRPVTGGRAIKTSVAAPAKIKMARVEETVAKPAPIFTPNASEEIIATVFGPVARSEKPAATVKETLVRATEKARAEEKATGGPSSGLLTALLGTAGVVAAAGTAAALAQRRKKQGGTARQKYFQPQQQDSSAPLIAGLGLLALVGGAAFLLLRKK